MQRLLYTKQTFTKPVFSSFICGDFTRQADIVILHHFGAGDAKTPFGESAISLYSPNPDQY